MEDETVSKFSNAQRAQILCAALPYINSHAGKTVVVKYGGNAMINEELKQQVMEDIVLLAAMGVKPVLVHGGGPDISEVMKKFGKKAEFVDGLRVTDAETAQIAQMVLAGKVNKDLVKNLQSIGGKVIGISGIDGKMLVARTKKPELGYVGSIIEVNIGIVQDVIDKGYIPVISTIASDKEGNTYNINGDTAAAYIAGALHAERLMMLTDIQGVLMDKDDESTLIPKMTIKEAVRLYSEGVISGGMIPKVDCCIEAIKAGVNSVTILDGRVPHAILMELLTDEGAGTMIVDD